MRYQKRAALSSIANGGRLYRNAVCYTCRGMLSMRGHEVAIRRSPLLWLSDSTEIPSIGKKIYAVASKDQASHRILGILLSNSLYTGTLITAFYKALHARNLINRIPYCTLKQGGFTAQIVCMMYLPGWIRRNAITELFSNNQNFRATVQAASKFGFIVRNRLRRTISNRLDSPFVDTLLHNVGLNAFSTGYGKRMVKF